MIIEQCFVLQSYKNFQQIRTQILSRAQGQLNLTGQVASMKAMTEATSSVQNNLSCVDSANMPQVIPQNDATVLSSGQSLANGGLNASTSVQVDNPAMAIADNTCNGSGILVFQQKSSGTINNATSTNVPVLVSFYLFFCISRYTEIEFKSIVYRRDKYVIMHNVILNLGGLMRIFFT